MQPFKRKVFYVGGFDPRGVRFYYALFAEQMRRQEARTSVPVTVSKRQNRGSLRSDWTARDAGGRTVVDYTFLRWEDIVLKGWIRNPLILVSRAVSAYRHLMRHADFRLARSFGRGPLITLFYPPVTAVVLPLLLALLTGMIAALIFERTWLAFAVGLALGSVLAAVLLRTIHSPWLLRFFIFNDEIARGRTPPALTARLKAFADEIAGGVDGYDEVLLLTHSNGSILSVSILNDLLSRWGGTAPASFTVVSMGHCIPLVACRRDAAVFRQELATLASHDFRWIDIGSPPDGAGYYGVNPLLICQDSARPSVELLSPRFHLFYDPANYRTGLASKYDIHFDYLRAGDRPSPIDFPNLMLSPRPIRESVALFREIE